MTRGNLSQRPDFGTKSGTRSGAGVTPLGARRLGNNRNRNGNGDKKATPRGTATAAGNQQPVRMRGHVYVLHSTAIKPRRRRIRTLGVLSSSVVGNGIGLPRDEGEVCPRDGSVSLPMPMTGTGTAGSTGRMKMRLRPLDESCGDPVRRLLLLGGGGGGGGRSMESSWSSSSSSSSSVASSQTAVATSGVDRSIGVGGDVMTMTGVTSVANMTRERGIGRGVEVGRGGGGGFAWIERE